jgi:hypothetical protein
MLLQPWSGYLHHRRFKKHGHKTKWTTAHVWFGRVLVLLGIVNGGLGLGLASGGVAYSEAGMIIYTICSGFAGLVLVALMAYIMMRQTTVQTGHHNQLHDIGL